CKKPLVLRDRYRANRVLGRGGFGATFLAQDESLPGQPACVIKQMRPPSDKPSMIESCRQLFEREANTLGKLSVNPQITRLLDFFEHQGEFYLVQEYIEGSNLQAELKRKGKFSEAKVKSLLKDLLRILHYLHGNKVIHRDIKPANIMRRSFDGRLVLIDFGGVKDQMGQTQILEDKKDGALTQFALGTLGFAPPEQLSKRPVYASDIYSLGATCFFLLTAKDPSELEYDPLTGDVTFPAELNVSQGFQAVLKTMIAESVRDRYKSAEEVLAALKELDAAPEETSKPQAAAPPRTEPRPAAESAASAVAVSSDSGGAAVATVKTPPGPGLSQAVAKVPSRMSELAASSTRSEVWSDPLSVAENYSATTIKTEKKRVYAWWNRPLIGDRPLTQRLRSLFFKLPISDRAIQIHQQSLQKITKLSNQAITVDSEKFSNDEFLAFVRMQRALKSGDGEYAYLPQSTELLQVGIEAKNAFLKIEQIEIAYRSSKQIGFYDYVQDLLSQNLDQETFIARIKAHVQTLIGSLRSQEGKASLSSYAEQLELLAEHSLGLKLLSLFKRYQLSDYSVLSAVSDMVSHMYSNELFDRKSLVAEVASQAQLFDQLGNIIGVPEEKRDPETYAKILQYIALSIKYKAAYGKFQSLVEILEHWLSQRDIIVRIRQEYSPKEYKYPKEFRVAIPGQDIYDKYESYFEAK
ncbi:MAG: serine/threonine-protein kinase, partial [Cyanobacteria bacterium P01_F01_bin.42]